jgi:transketolase
MNHFAFLLRMRKTFVRTLLGLMRHDPRIWVLTPDMGFSVLEPFQKEFAERFLNTGIAEQNTIGLAAGLALAGKKVYVYSIIPFVTMRCFEQVRVDLAYMDTDVKLIGVGAGYTYGSAGATHHAIEDIAIMRALPNMTVCCPGDPVEVQAITEQSSIHQGPMYIRLGKNGESNIKDAVIFVTSNMLQTAAQVRVILAAQRVDVALVSFPTVKPLDTQAILNWASRRIPIVTLEEHNLMGGFGSGVAEVLTDAQAQVSMHRMGISDFYTHDIGNADFLRDKVGLTPEKISARVLAIVKGSNVTT